MTARFVGTLEPRTKLSAYDLASFSEAKADQISDRSTFWRIKTVRGMNSGLVAELERQ